MKIKEHDCVVLTSDSPRHKLEKGDVGTVLHIHHDEGLYEVEFTTVDGRVLMVTALEIHKLRLVSLHDITHSREMR